MKTNNYELSFDLDLYEYDSDEIKAKKLSPDQQIYTWCSEGSINYLSKGYCFVNSMSIYVILPAGLPNLINMPDDEKETDDRDLIDGKCPECQDEERQFISQPDAYSTYHGEGKVLYYGASEIIDDTSIECADCGWIVPERIERI